MNTTSYLSLVFMMMVASIRSSDVESDSNSRGFTRRGKGGGRRRRSNYQSTSSNQQSHDTLHNGYNGYKGYNPSHNPSYNPSNNPSYNPLIHQLRYNQERGITANGALFGSVSPFPVMDSEGKVTLSHANPAPLNPTISSANTPNFPSLLGRRLRGYPSHFEGGTSGDGLNYFVGNERMNREFLQQHQNQHQMPSSMIPTEAIDQGPLSPAPKSLMEQAGWWEYLALLFGDSGDSTALRLILHRLTKLAQLQLGPVEAARAQAATAFLAHHFKSLLAASFRDFVYDPDYTHNSATWSSDPGFSNIIRRLVDHMDYFGARADLDSIFGPNTRVALSFGMRQPEWLRLKLIIEQISWDLRHPNDLIGLWAEEWKLSVPQKLSILAFASNPTANAPLDLNLPHRDLVLARINLITNGQAPRDKNLIKMESPLAQAHYHYALQQSTNSLCKTKEEGSRSTPQSSPQSQSQSSPQSNSQFAGFKNRVKDYCEMINLTPNFVQFCQSGPNDSTPIASLLSAAGGLFERSVITYMNHLERLFWAFTWSGSCMEAREVVATLTEQIKSLAPQQARLRRGQRVPTDVADSIQVRLEYMQAVQQRCQNNLQLTGSADVAHIFSLLNYGHLNEALAEWERRFSSVSARLQGYPGGAFVVSGQSQLLYQQARDVRIALLIYKYPKSVYVPCLSKGLLTRDPSTDLTLLNLTHSLDTTHSRGDSSGDNIQSQHSSLIDPLIPQMSARSLYMRALYLAGHYGKATSVAREISAANPNKEDAQMVHEFLACTQLCGSTTRNPCEAEKTYDSLLKTHTQRDTHTQTNSQTGNSQTRDTHSQNHSHAQAHDSSHVVYTVGKELSSRLCRLSRNTATDALSLRYGKVLTTQATFSAFNRIIQQQQQQQVNEHKQESVGYHSKLEKGQPESILPWFGTLPPAPIDDILSFVPTHKLNFISQVGISGVPLIKASKSAQPSTANPKAANNGKIFVLGHEYDANYLTESNGHGNTQPKTKVKDGYFQLESDQHNHQGNQSTHQSSSSSTTSGSQHSGGEEEEEE
jgi:hypothetical protein